MTLVPFPVSLLCAERVKQQTTTTTKKERSSYITPVTNAAPPFLSRAPCYWRSRATAPPTPPRTAQRRRRRRPRLPHRRLPFHRAIRRRHRPPLCQPTPRRVTPPASDAPRRPRGEVSFPRPPVVSCILLMFTPLHSFPVAD